MQQTIDQLNQDSPQVDHNQYKPFTICINNVDLWLHRHSFASKNSTILVYMTSNGKGSSNCL